MAAAILFFCTVFGDLAADSSLGPYAVEGQWLLEARQAATGEEVPLHEWRPGLLMPMQTWLTTQGFRMLGTRLESARALSGLLSLLTVLLFFRLAVGASGTQAGLWATMLLLCNPMFQAISRMALPSIFSLFGMLLTVWLWRLGKRNSALAFLTGMLVAWTALGENSPNSIFFLGSAALVLLSIRVHAIKMPWRSTALSRLSAVLWGVAAVAGGLLVVVIGHWNAYGCMWDHFTTFNWRIVVSNLVMAPMTLSSTVSQMPITAILALVYFLFFAKLTVRPVVRHRRINETRMWFLAWLLVGGVYMVFSSPRLEAQVLLVPPLCLLAGEGLTRLAGLRRISRPSIDVMIVTLMIFGAVWFGVACLVRGYYDLLPQRFWQAHHIRGTALLVFVLWPLVALTLTWFYLKWKRFTVPLGSRQVSVMAWLILVAALARGGYEIETWYRHRTHEVQRASQALGRELGKQDLVVGTWAPILTLDTPARATMVWSEVNDEPADWHRRVTHLLLVRGRETNPRRPPVRTFLLEGRRLQPVSDTLGIGALTLELHALTPQ